MKNQTNSIKINNLNNLKNNFEQFEKSIKFNENYSKINLELIKNK